MKINPIYFAFLLTSIIPMLALFGCRKVTSNCPEKPTATLYKANLKSISLSEKSITESNKVSFSEAVGYSFEGKAGQTLSYKTDADVCVWIYTPDSKILKGTTKLPQDGTYIVQIAAPQGSKSFKLDISYQSVKSPSPELPLSEPPPSSTLTKEEALAIVKNWYEAKPRIFGSSFDQNLVAKYATGQLYYETLEKGDGGSVGWLKTNGCYYTYDGYEIEKILAFNPSESKPSIKVQVFEKLSRQGCSRYYIPLHDSREQVTYWFTKDGDQWKIEKYLYPGKPE